MSEENRTNKNKAFLHTALKGLKHILLHNGWLKAIAVLISVVLWAGLISQDETLTRDKTFQNVNVSITGSDTLRNNGYIVVSDLTEVLNDVSVVAAVPQKQYEDADASAYYVRVDLSKINGAGEQEVKLQSTNSTTYGRVISTTPASVNCTVTVVAPENTILGLFSVSATKKVLFSKGNLQATTSNNGSSWSWTFAAYQYSYIGSAEANTIINDPGSMTGNGTVDLFGWSTSSTTYGISNSQQSTNYNGDFYDWGNAIDGSTWRTLTSTEWSYLLNTRTTKSGRRYLYCTINSDTTTPVNGLLLFPDSFTGSVEGSEFTSTVWNTLAAAGCVFLPKAGHRSGTSVSDVQSAGYYWDSDNSGGATDANAFWLGGSTGQNVSRSWGYSVRLVQDF